MTSSAQVPTRKHPSRCAVRKAVQRSAVRAQPLYLDFEIDLDDLGGGNPEYAAGRLALRCIVANSDFRHIADRHRAGALLDERSHRKSGQLIRGDRAKREQVERHIRHLAPLAFVSPRIVEAIANGSAPADLTATTLARAQEYKVGIT